jgi:hypothetical protein
MSWDEFTACASADGVILADASEDAIKQLTDLWDSQPWYIKAALEKAAEYGGSLLADALAAAGLLASEAIAAAAAGVGIGAMVAVVADCYDKL